MFSQSLFSEAKFSQRSEAGFEVDRPAWDIACKEETSWFNRYKRQTLTTTCEERLAKEEAPEEEIK